MQANPDEPVSVSRVNVIMKYAELYHQTQPEVWADVVDCVGDYNALDKRLYRAREKIVGKAPKNRNEFDPSSFFDASENVDDIIVLDSNKLPAGWKTRMEEKVAENESLRSREWGNINETVREYENSMDAFEQAGTENVEEEDVEEENSSASLPKRVLAFTSKKLLTIFETNLSGRSSVDGTFKSIPVLWKQLFIWMVKYSGFWIPVCWAWLPDKSEVSYKVLIHMVQEKLSELNIKFNIKEVISDFEINIQKAADQMLPEIQILGCFFHLSKCFWKRLQMKGMVTEYDNNAKFREFVKSAIALAHLPLADLEDGVDHLKSFQFVDEKCQEFQTYLCTYISEYWIHGPFPPQVWNCFSRTDDLTNNNQEGFNSKINKEVKQIHPTPGQLAMFIKKQIKLSEIDVMRADSGLSKPKQRLTYKNLAEKRKNMKTNYSKSRMPQYLRSMGSGLVTAHLNSGRVDDPIESSAPRTDSEENLNDRSSWMAENIEGPDTENVAEDPVENPYEGRRIGGRRNEKKKSIAKKKCPRCSKGFNVKSVFVDCHSCDKLTHTKCIDGSYDEEHFQCIECKPVSNVENPIDEPAPSEPTVSEPTAPEPGPSEPGPSEPVPSEPTAFEPTASKPTPPEPGPSESTPFEPSPSEPAPSGPSNPDVNLPASAPPRHVNMFDSDSNIINDYGEIVVPAVQNAI